MSRRTRFVSRDPMLFVRDIEASCAKIVGYTAGLSREEVFAETMRIDAILMNLHTIGEAVKRLPDEFKLIYFDVPWRRISGMRDFIAHVYFALDLDIVWDTISSDIPELLQRVREIISIEAAD